LLLFNFVALTRITRCGLFHPGAGPESQHRLRQRGTLFIFFTLPEAKIPFG